MFGRQVDTQTTPIAQVYENWERIWLGEREIRRFLAFTGLSALPYNLRVENFLKFPYLRGMTARRFVQKLRRLGVTWSWNEAVVRRSVLLSVGYKLCEVEEFEHNRIFGRKEVGANV